jgi:hypothetical protein
MRATAATVGIVSAAVFLGPGCDQPDQVLDTEQGAALRRAAFKSFAARDRLTACGSLAARQEAAMEVERFEELQRFAQRRTPAAAHAVWRARNEWNALAGRGAAPGCGGYEAALGAFRGSLAEFGERIKDFQE